MKSFFRTIVRTFKYCELRQWHLSSLSTGGLNILDPQGFLSAVSAAQCQEGFWLIQAVICANMLCC